MRASKSYRISPGCALSGSVCRRQAVQILNSLFDARVAEGSSTVGMKLNPIMIHTFDPKLTTLQNRLSDVASLVCHPVILY